MYIYVFEDKNTSWVKVGVTENPPRRFEKFGDSVGTVFVVEVADKQRALAIEKIVLSRLSERFPSHGEWIQCSFGFARESVENALLVDNGLLSTTTETLAAAESSWKREFVREALARCGWSVSAAAVLLGRNRTETYKLIKRLNIDLVSERAGK